MCMYVYLTLSMMTHLGRSVPRRPWSCSILVTVAHRGQREARTLPLHCHGAGTLMQQYSWPDSSLGGRVMSSDVSMWTGGTIIMASLQCHIGCSAVERYTVYSSPVLSLLPKVNKAITHVVHSMHWPNTSA